MIPRLDIKHLVMLDSLAATASVTETAQRLGLTQSAVSHRIRETERRLGVAILRRAGTGVVLSPAAARLPSPC
jgi:LysR family transcriptional regulator for metE and metH